MMACKVEGFGPIGPDKNVAAGTYDTALGGEAFDEGRGINRAVRGRGFEHEG